MNYHAPAASLFDPSARCGASADTEPDGTLHLHAVEAEVSCAACRVLLLGEVCS